MNKEKKTPKQELDDYEERRTLRQERADYFAQKPDDINEDDEEEI